MIKDLKVIKKIVIQICMHQSVIKRRAFQATMSDSPEERKWSEEPRGEEAVGESSKKRSEILQTLYVILSSLPIILSDIA